MKRATTIAIGALLLPAITGTASAQLYAGYSGGESYFEDFEAGTSGAVPAFDLFEAYAAAADDANEVLWLTGPDPASAFTSSLFRWDYGSVNAPVEVGPIQDPSAIGYRWDALAYDNHTDTLYTILAFPPFGAPSGARGLYTLDPVTLQAVQVLSWSGVSIAALAYNRTDGMLYAPDDVAMQIVRIDPALGTITPVPGSTYPMGIVDLDGCAIGGNRVYMVDDDDMGPVLVFNLATGMYESNTSITAPFASGACAAAWLPNNAQGTTATYCTPANLNSTGVPAVMEARGSNYALDNEMTLVASSLPNGAFGFFLTSQASGFSANPGGSQGNLCLGGSIGRFVGPGEVQNTGLSGEFSLEIDLLQVPSPTGLVAVMPGETWYYQGWFRDAVGGMATSNLTDGVSVIYQ